MCLLGGSCNEAWGCAEILACALDGCAYLVPPCLVPCFEQGTELAKLHFSLLASCLAEACPLPVTAACAAEAVTGACNLEARMCRKVSGP